MNEMKVLFESGLGSEDYSIHDKLIDAAALCESIDSPESLNESMVGTIALAALQGAVQGAVMGTITSAALIGIFVAIAKIRKAVGAKLDLSYFQVDKKYNELTPTYCKYRKGIEKPMVEATKIMTDYTKKYYAIVHKVTADDGVVESAAKELDSLVEDTTRKLKSLEYDIKRCSKTDWVESMDIASTVKDYISACIGFYYADYSMIKKSVEGLTTDQKKKFSKIDFVEMHESGVITTQVRVSYKKSK